MKRLLLAMDREAGFSTPLRSGRDDSLSGVETEGFAFVEDAEVVGNTEALGFDA